MRDFRLKPLAALVILLTLIFMGFQNCSQVSFSTAPASSLNAVTDIEDPTPIIRSLQPTLAVRGIGCIQCHATVSSTVITDFGYGDSYYFGSGSTAGWANGTPYGDHGKAMDTLNMPADQTVVVPRAELPSVAQNDMNVLTIAEYLRSRFSHAAADGTKGVTVREVSSVFIGAPTEDDIASAFKLGAAERLKFVRDRNSKTNLQGLIDRGAFFQNGDTMVCNGDVAVRGPLFLQNLRLETSVGCRLYVIGSVFISGPITYLTSDESRNLQISSTKSISLGLGMEKMNGAHCEPGSRWATASDSSYNRFSSLRTFYVDMWTTPNTFVRGVNDPVRFGETILAEAELIEAQVGTLPDASCEANGRNVPFERILLNAPMVYSRYSGGMKGTVIAEVAMMNIGDFKFQYDPVFNSVNVLPFLSRSKLLDVKE